MAEKFDPANAHNLENPERLRELPPATVVHLLQLEGAETVVDYGAGTGMYTIPIARALPHGRVIAVEAYPQLLEMLTTKLAGSELAARIALVQADGRQRGPAAGRQRRPRAPDQRAAPHPR